MKKNNKVEKNKKKKKIVPYSKKELLFNVISLLFAIGVGLYFGGRSFFYYSKEFMRIETEALTLNGTITNNNYTVTDGEGLHQDTDGYYFKGNALNNYVKFGNRLFRIIRINNDNTVRVVSDDIVSSFMWGEDNNYVNSNLDKWLDKKEDVNGSGIYYDTIPYVEDYLEKTTYTIPVFDGKSVVNGKKELSSYVTTLSIKDYSTANGKNSYLNIGKYFWLVGTDEEDNNLYVSEDGSLLDGSLYETYGIRPVFTFKKNTPITGGIGTKDDPYVINQGDKTNMINETIKINNDIWRVHYDKDNIVKATLYKYVGGSFIYSDESSEFNLLDRGSAAEYLNNSFLSSLPYNNNLQDMTIYTGEVSGDTSLDFTNIYNNNTIAKIGLLNMFDYHILGVDDYYLSNTTSNRGTMVYVYHDYGILEEVQITEPKAMIVTASFKKDDLIKSNDGYYTVR